MNKVHVILFISFLLFLLVAEGLGAKVKGGKKKGAGAVGGAVGGAKGGKLGAGAAAGGKKGGKALTAGGKPVKGGKPAKGGKAVDPKKPVAGAKLNPNNLPEVVIDKSEATLVYVVAKDTYNLPWVPMEPLSALQILNSHNAFRKLLGIPALRWSYQLEQSAWNWVRNCVPAHDPNLEYPLGENMASITSDAIKIGDETKNKKPGELEMGAGQQWLSEISSYDCKKNDCRINPTSNKEQVCGHFVQAAWNGTTHIGCAVMNCNSNSPFQDFVPQAKRDFWRQISCRYYPPAWVNERPFNQRFCGSIDALSKPGKIEGLDNISGGFGPLGRSPGVGDPNSIRSVSTGAARVIPKFGTEVAV